MVSQSPRSTAAVGVSQDPPTQATLGNARNSGAVSRVMPPVGQKTASGKGPASAFSMPTPPAWCAGNSFIAVKPAAPAAMTSDGVITPGSSGSALARAASASSGVNPGLTPKRAPACYGSGKVLGAGDRADADDRVFHLAADPRDGIQRRRGAQRHLEDADAALDQRAGQRHRIFRLVNDDDRDHRPQVQQLPDGHGIVSGA